LLTGYEQISQKNKLKPNNGEELRLLT